MGAPAWVTRRVCMLRLVSTSVVCTSYLSSADLWQGNTGAMKDRTPFACDPACWYGHHEFDLALSSMFGGFLP